MDNLVSKNHISSNTVSELLDQAVNVPIKNVMERPTLPTTVGQSLSPFATHVISLKISNSNDYRNILLAAFSDTWRMYETLFDSLKPEALSRRADPLRHPLIFYYGHTAVFTINKLIVGKCLTYKDRIDSKIESLMAVGVDEMSWDDLVPDSFDWPSFDVVHAYRQKAYGRVVKFIQHELVLKDHSVVDWAHPAWIVHMAIEHERIHLETSAVLIRQLPLDSIKSGISNVFTNGICPVFEKDVSLARKRLASANNSRARFEAKGQSLFLGRDFKRSSINAVLPPYPREQLDSYGWDNEYGTRQTTVANNFEASRCLVSNAEFLEFVENGGYTNLSFWSEEGKKWLAYSKAAHPRFWYKKPSGQFALRLTLQLLEDMPWDWPVECNYLEADAYCRYISEKSGAPARLPSEAEHYWMLYSAEPAACYETISNKGLNPLRQQTNFGMNQFTSSCPADMFGLDTDRGRLYDLWGNVWQHLRTTIYPFDGFKTHPCYDDFTVPSFDDRHTLMAGGSWISLGNETTPFPRFAFRRHFYQFAGFRLVHPDGASLGNIEEEYEAMNAQLVSKGAGVESTLLEDAASNNPYETDMLVNQYIDFHYGTLPALNPAFKDIQNFPELCADVCLAVLQKSAAATPADASQWRILDLGSAVCRSTFELAKHNRVQEAVGLDLSARFIMAAHQLKEHGRLRYSVPRQGDIIDYKEIQFGAQTGKDCGATGTFVPLDGHACTSWLNGHFGLNLRPFITENMPAIIEKCHFLQGDACNLSVTHSLLTPSNPYDLILAANLIDRLYEPAAFLAKVGDRLKAGGFLVLTSPYTWLEEYTKKQHWLGAKRINGENVETLDALTETLAGTFAPVDLQDFFFSSSGNATAGKQTVRNAKRRKMIAACPPEDFLEGASQNAFSVPMVIRETERKYQFTMVQVSIWRKL